MSIYRGDSERESHQSKNLKTIFNQILTLSLKSNYTMAQKTFPDYFADAGIEASTEIAEFQRALCQVQMV